MKLYTEEQVMDIVRLTLEDAEASVLWSKEWYPKKLGERLMQSLTPIELPSESLCVNCDATKPIHKVCMDCIIKMGKENIELPSDEEINDEWEVGHSDYQDGCNYGAKWLRDKIKGEK